MVVVLILLLWCSPVATFSPPRRPTIPCWPFIVRQLRPRHGEAPPSTTLAFLASFDFASASAWEAYYATDDDAVEEWHSSISLDVIADRIIDADQQQPLQNNNTTKILMVGCGTSRLPEAIWQQSANAGITLLDSSTTCVKQLQNRYGELAHYVCGDALRLSKLVRDGKGNSLYFDSVVDKGLIDALLCGEGWNGPIQQLLKEAVMVLRPYSGRYILISYRLPTSTKDFLASVGQDIGLIWQFDCEGSNDRVGISIATKIIA